MGTPAEATLWPSSQAPGGGAALGAGRRRAADLPADLRRAQGVGGVRGSRFQPQSGRRRPRLGFSAGPAEPGVTPRPWLSHRRRRRGRRRRPGRSRWAPSPTAAWAASAARPSHRLPGAGPACHPLGPTAHPRPARSCGAASWVSLRATE